MTILGNFLNRLCRSGSHTCRTKLVVDISTFQPEYRDVVVRSIVSNMARGGGAADWCLTDAGVMFATFGPMPNTFVVTEDNSVQVVTRLTCKQPGSAWLTIHMRMVRDADVCESVDVLGVTDDGQWLSCPRRHSDMYSSDEYTSETHTTSYCADMVSHPDYTDHTEYGMHLFV